MKLSCLSGFGKKKNLETQFEPRAKWPMKYRSAWNAPASVLHCYFPSPSVWEFSLRILHVLKFTCTFHLFSCKQVARIFIFLFKGLYGWTLWWKTFLWLILSRTDLVNSFLIEVINYGILINKLTQWRQFCPLVCYSANSASVSW